MSKDMNVKTLAGGTLEASVTTESFTSEKEAAYAANQLSSDRHEDTHDEYQAAAENRPMAARSLSGSPVHDLAGADPKKQW